MHSLKVIIDFGITFFSWNNLFRHSIDWFYSPLDRYFIGVDGCSTLFVYKSLGTKNNKTTKNEITKIKTNAINYYIFMNIVLDKLSDFHMELVHWYYRNFSRKLRFKKFCIGVGSYWVLIASLLVLGRLVLQNGQICIITNSK